MSVQKSWSELQTMARACRIVVETLDLLEAAAQPGVTTKQLDRVAREAIVKAGARPAFLGYRDYPATLCISVNEEIVHGIPGPKKLREGDIVGLDLGCIVDGFYGDAARTVAVGRASAEAERLMQVTREALFAGIEMCHPGKRVGDIGHAVQTHAESFGYSVVKDFVGHGIGTSLHEEPQVPNYGPAGRGDAGRQPVGALRAVDRGDRVRAVDPVGPVPVRGGRGGECLKRWAAPRRRGRARRSSWTARCGRRCRTRSSASSSRAGPRAR